MKKKIISAFIFSKNGDILICHPETNDENDWIVPTGFKDDDENEWECLKRTVYLTTNLKLNELKINKVKLPDYKIDDISVLNSFAIFLLNDFKDFVLKSNISIFSENFYTLSRMDDCRMVPIEIASILLMEPHKSYLKHFKKK